MYCKYLMPGAAACSGTALCVLCGEGVRAAGTSENWTQRLRVSCYYVDLETVNGEGIERGI